MIVYLDYVFIENFIIDFVMLKETAYLSRRNIKSSKGILAAIVSSVYVILLMLFKIQALNYIVSKLVLVIIIVYIAFLPKRIDEYIKLVIVFVGVSILNVGTLMVITSFLNLQEPNIFLKLCVYITSALISRFYMKGLWTLYKRQIKEEDLLYEVNIQLSSKKYCYKAFLDTGNSVYSYTYNLPVIFAEILDKEMLTDLENETFFTINTLTLSGESSKKAYVLEDVVIRKKDYKWKVKVGIVFDDTKLSKDGSYNMLLNYHLYAQELGGIKI